MSQPHPFALVDVFSDRPLAGNPLAVVADADDVDDDTLRSVAREADQAETTLLRHPTLPGSTARLRSFTVGGAEVVGAGHNSLGAWWWLACSGRLTLVGDGRTDLFQEIGGEQLPVAPA